MDKITIAGLVFESIKQIYEFLKKSDALWLNNHLDDHGEDAPEYDLEIYCPKLGTGETIKKVVKIVQAHADKKNHDFH